MSSLEITLFVAVIGLIALLVFTLRNNSALDFERKRGLPRFENPPPPPLMKIKKEDFILRVKMLSNKNDFEANSQFLEIIDKNYYEIFLDLLKIGYSIYPASKAMTEIVGLSVTTALSTGEIVGLIPTYQFLISLKIEGFS